MDVDEIDTIPAVASIDVNADGDADADDAALAQTRTQPEREETSAAPADDAAASATAEGDGEDEEEEYEIESILSHEVGRFVEGEMAYLVSWKDYNEDHNSWVREVDAEGAQDMINEYWSKTPRKDIKKAGPTPKGRKKGKQATKGGQSSLLRAAATSSPAATASSKKRARDGSAIGLTRTRGSQGATGSTAASTSTRRAANRSVEAVPSRSPSPFEADEGVDERLEEIANDDSLTPADKLKLQREHLQQQKVEHMKRKYGRIANWEPIVRQITGIENIGGNLWAYFNFTSGDQLSFPLMVAEDRCPRQLNKFFIAHLRFRTADGFKEYVAPTPEPSSEAIVASGEANGERSLSAAPATSTAGEGQAGNDASSEPSAVTGTEDNVVAISTLAETRTQPGAAGDTETATAQDDVEMLQDGANDTAAAAAAAAPESSAAGAADALSAPPPLTGSSATFVDAEPAAAEPTAAIIAAEASLAISEPVLAPSSPQPGGIAPL